VILLDLDYLSLMIAMVMFLTMCAYVVITKLNEVNKSLYMEELNVLAEKIATKIASRIRQGFSFEDLNASYVYIEVAIFNDIDDYTLYRLGTPRTASILGKCLFFDIVDGKLVRIYVEVYRGDISENN